MSGFDLGMKSSLLLAIAALANLFLRRRSAALRHMIWSLAFAGVLILPLASVVLPAMHMPVRSALPFEDLVFRGGSTAQQTVSVLPPRSAVLPFASFNWLPILLAVWAVGSAVGMGQMLMGWVRLQRLQLKAKVFGPSMHGVALLESGSGSMPMTYGLWRPVIFLPVEARHWTGERLQVVLQHELAHVARCDSALHVLGKLALIVHWWNPLAWWAWRQFLNEQEQAADDLVIGGGITSSNYAEHLLQIARSMQMMEGSPALAMASKSQLRGRIEAILDSTRDRRATSIKVKAAAAIISISLVLPLAAMHPGISAIEGGTSLDLLENADHAREKGTFDVAMKLYDEFLSTHPTADDAAKCHIHRGVLELLMKDYPSAASDFEAALASRDSQGEALMWDAIASERLNAITEARGHFDESIAASKPPELATVMEVYAKFLDRIGNANEATTMVAKAREIRNTHVSPAPESTEWSMTAVRAGSGVKSPQLASKVEPGYTAEARAAQYSGTVRLTVVVGTDGKTHDVQVTKGLGLGLGLDPKTILAVSQWTFKPGIKDGQPVNVKASIEVSFRLL